MITETVGDHVFHTIESGEEMPTTWANPRFGHRLDWSPYCPWCRSDLAAWLRKLVSALRADQN